MAARSTSRDRDGLRRAVRHKGAVDVLAARNDYIDKYNAETRDNARNTAKQ